MSHLLIGKYDTKNLSVLFISIGLYLLGAFSVIGNTIYFIFNLSNDVFDLESLVFSTIGAPSVISFTVYYIIILFKKEYLNKLVSYSFTAYILIYYCISKTYHFLPYLLILFCMILLYHSFSHHALRKLSVALFTWLTFIIFSIKQFAISDEILEIIEISEQVGKDFFLILAIVLSGVIIGLVWLWFTELGERNIVRRKLEELELTPTEIKVAIFYLLNHTPDSIAKKLGKDQKNTLYTHHKNIKKKLNIGDINKKALLQVIDT